MVESGSFPVAGPSRLGLCCPPAKLWCPCGAECWGGERMGARPTQAAGPFGCGVFIGVFLALHLGMAAEAQAAGKHSADPLGVSVAPRPAQAKPAESQPVQSEPAAAVTDSWAVTRAHLAVRYAEARREYDAGRYDLACPIFQEIFELDGSPASLLDLGICRGEQAGWRNARASFEQLVLWEETALGLLYLGFSRRDDGDLAGALAAYERAAALDSTAGTLEEQSRQLVSSEIARLRAIVPQLLLVVADAAGSVATIDEKPIVLDGTPIRLNAGPHRLDVRAEGMAPWSSEFVSQPASTATIEIPALVPLPTAPVVPEPAAEKPSSPSAPPPSLAPAGALPLPRPVRRERLSWGLVGGGAALVGAGLVVGQLTLREEGRLQECDNDCGALSNGTRDLKRTTDVLWVAGALVAGVGVGLLVFDEGGSEDSDRASVSLGCGVFACAVSAQGRF